jgi:hypothetical protein
VPPTTPHPCSYKQEQQGWVEVRNRRTELSVLEFEFINSYRCSNCHGPGFVASAV